ncbi:MAG: cob(I)yrinic acid a,c-diamide adenosyltransferase [Deltaproteobacteria bacterium]|nr:cob(I)yrinic acid a,c-diamide adenosyltransferase [Deltaproteobacteria bacterium]
MLHERPRNGLVMIMTGDGKGKTTSALGQALRALGHGYKVCMIQFMKGRKYGEFLAAERWFSSEFAIHLCGLDSFVMRDNPAPVDVEMAKAGLALAKHEMASGKWDMIILDEINVALDFKLIALTDVIDLVDNKQPTLDLILTGRNALPELIEKADTVSEVREIKHHYASGIKERAGIEY